MPKRRVKPTPKKIKTLIPEPNWERLSKAKTEEKQVAAYNDCVDFVHYEVSERDQVAGLKKWVRNFSGWDLHEQTKVLPDTFMTPFAKYGFIACQLGYMPPKILTSMEENLRPMLVNCERYRERIVVEPLVHPDVSAKDDDHFLAEAKVREWAEYWKDYIKANKKDAEGKDSARRLALQSAENYLGNIRTYLRTGVWLDHRYGKMMEFKILHVCKVPAYDRDGVIKRTVGVFYPDIGHVWKGQYES